MKKARMISFMALHGSGFFDKRFLRTHQDRASHFDQ